MRVASKPFHMWAPGFRRAILYRSRLLRVCLLSAVLPAAGISFGQSVAATPGKGTANASTVTYSHDIAPFLQRNCVSCHNPTGSAPFTLQSYAAAKQWGGQMLDVTQSRYMPPWLPVPNLHEAKSAVALKGDRRLSDSDLELIRGWVSAGMPEGGAAAVVPYSSIDLLRAAGKPDLVLTVAQPVDVPPAGPDLFFTFAVPVPSGPARLVKAIGIEASDPQAAHAILIGVDREHLVSKGHPEAAQGGLPVMELSPSLTQELAPDGQLLLWTPNTPLLQAGSAWTLPGGSDVVLSAHIKTTGRAEKLTLKVLLFYAPEGQPAQSRALLHVGGDSELDIPPGNKDQSVEAETTLRQAITLTSIYPRAHYAAHSLEAYATLPDGSRRTLLTIEKWDVDWAGVYRFVKPVALPKGAVLHTRFTYDNSSSNPHNPSDPPQKIVAGHGTRDEINEVWLETAGPR